MTSDRKAEIQALYVGRQSSVFGNVSRVLTALHDNHLPPGPILDAGCGNGVITQRIAWAFPDRSVIGIDFSPEQIDYAQANHAAPNLTYRVGDADDLPEGPFAAIVALFVVQYLDDLPHFLRNAHKRLIPGGWLYYSTQLLPETEPGRDLAHAIWTAFMWHSITFLSLSEHKTMLEAAGFQAIRGQRFPTPIDSLTPKRQEIVRQQLAAHQLSENSPKIGDWLSSGEFTAQPRMLYVDRQPSTLGNADRVLSALRDNLPRGPILDFGCANSEITRQTAWAFPNRTVVGYIFSGDDILRTHANVIAPNLQLYRVRVNKLPRGSFAAILAIDVVQYFADFSGFLTAVYECLAPGGYFHYSTQLLPDTKPGHDVACTIWTAFMPHSVTLLSLSEHKMMLAASGFRIVQSQTFPTSFGTMPYNRQHIIRQQLIAYNLPKESPDIENWLSIGEFTVRRPISS